MLDIETVRKTGAIVPSNKDLEAAIVGVIQFGDIHQPEEIFNRALFFINRVDLNQNKPAKYLPTWSQFESVKKDLIAREIVCFLSARPYYYNNECRALSQQ